MPAFVDTNVVVYAFAGDARKAGVADTLLGQQPTISVQVVNEFLNISRIKLNLPVAERHRLARELMLGSNVVALDDAIVSRAMDIEARYQLSLWDALIVAAALAAGCDTLYTEDMQHGQVFDGLLTVVDPFR